MKPTVYLETSVISYLAARPSRDLIVAAHQQISQTWWATREDWDLCVSVLVVAEARSGDTAAAQRRLALLGELPLLILNDAATDLAERLLTAAGFRPPIICTPEELLGDRYVD